MEVKFYPKTYTFPAGCKAIVTPCSVSRPEDSPQVAVELQALWDTGAVRSMIDKEVAIGLGLDPTVPVIISTATRREKVDTFTAKVILPNDNYIEAMTLCAASLGKDYQMIIGMDIIRGLDIAITHNDKKELVFSFNLPPTYIPIDFEDINR